ncbi:MAG: threonine synthase [Rhodothermales bacterium]
MTTTLPTGSDATFVAALEGAIDGERFAPGRIYDTHKGRPILVRYDLGRVANAVSKGQLAGRDHDLWRLRELLPIAPGDEVSLGEVVTPVIPCPKTARRYGLRNVWVKDESMLPTGSFKSRGQAVAISMAKKLGIERVAIPTAGNAGGAMAAYAARAGLEAWVFMPEDTPVVNRMEAVLAGAHVYLVEGLIDDCGKIVAAGKESMGWFDLSTLKEPYRLEGKKTMGFELAEQFNWRLPDVILYPTGGGTGLIGMWKAFHELVELGWIEANHLPRMVAVQSEGCCPVVRAYDRGDRFCERFEHAETIARGLRVPGAVGDFLILDAIRESKGCAVAVEEARIEQWMRRTTADEGISICPESAACVGALEKLSEMKWIAPNEHVVLFNCASSRKYSDLIDLDLPKLKSADAVDWDHMRRHTARSSSKNITVE